MYDGEYEKLRKAISGHVTELAALDFENFNDFANEELALKGQLDAVMRNLSDATTGVNQVLFEIGQFLDRKYGSPVKPKSVPVSAKATPKPWERKI